MLTKKDRDIIKECGHEYLLDIVMNSKAIKEQTTFAEHIKLCSYVLELKYEDVVRLTITEDVRAFESKFSKFLKYSFAAIAGSSFFGLAPPIAMFALYIYRKLTDTCEKKCYANIPFSSKRKLCKYKCQLDVARKVTDDLRADLGKCDEFQNPDKCERKLRSEYMKWAGRVQQLQVKIRQIDIKVNSPETRPTFRMRSGMARARNLSASLQLTPNQIAKFIYESEELRNKLSFKKHLLLYNEFNMQKKS